MCSSRSEAQMASTKMVEERQRLTTSHSSFAVSMSKARCNVWLNWWFQTPKTDLSSLKEMRRWVEGEEEHINEQYKALRQYCNRKVAAILNWPTLTKHAGSPRVLCPGRARVIQDTDISKDRLPINRSKTELGFFKWKEKNEKERQREE